MRCPDFRSALRRHRPPAVRGLGPVAGGGWPRRRLQPPCASRPVAAPLAEPARRRPSPPAGEEAELVLMNRRIVRFRATFRGPARQRAERAARDRRAALSGRQRHRQRAAQPVGNIVLDRRPAGLRAFTPRTDKPRRRDPRGPHRHHHLAALRTALADPARAATARPRRGPGGVGRGSRWCSPCCPGWSAPARLDRPPSAARHRRANPAAAAGRRRADPRRTRAGCGRWQPPARPSGCSPPLLAYARLARGWRCSPTPGPGASSDDYLLGVLAGLGRASRKPRPTCWWRC